MSSEDPLARIHREYREECQRLGTYKPIPHEELRAIEARWKAEARRKLELSLSKPKKKRRKKPGAA